MDGLRGKRRLRLAVCILCAVLLLSAAGGLLFSCFAEKRTDETPIALFEDVQLRATYLTGKDGLSERWDPDGFVLTHSGTDDDGDLWEIYSTDIYLDGVDLRMHFCEQGIEVLTSLTGLTAENYEAGLQLAQCLIYSVQNYTYTNMYDMLTDRGTYPMSVADDAGLLQLAQLPDPSAEKIDEGTQPVVERVMAELGGSGERKGYLVIDRRTRVWGGKEVYDLLILHTQE